MVAERVMLARAWRISPSELRNCTLLEARTMRALLDLEIELRSEHG